MTSYEHTVKLCSSRCITKQETAAGEVCVQPVVPASLRRLAVGQLLA